MENEFDFSFSFSFLGINFSLWNLNYTTISIEISGENIDLFHLWISRRIFRYTLFHRLFEIKYCWNRNLNSWVSICNKIIWSRN